MFGITPAAVTVFFVAFTDTPRAIPYSRISPFISPQHPRAAVDCFAQKFIKMIAARTNAFFFFPNSPDISPHHLEALVSA
jgi:hypothetical protein